MRKLAHFHLFRAGLWVLLAPFILLTSLKDAVWVVILLSLYANFTGDVGAWQAARVEAKQDEADEEHRTST